MILFLKIHAVTFYPSSNFPWLTFQGRVAIIGNNDTGVDQNCEVDPSIKAYHFYQSVKILLP